MKGFLFKTNGEWSVFCESIDRFLPLHPDEVCGGWEEKWLKEGLDVEFEVVTICIGDSEFDLRDIDVAKIINI